MNYLKVQTELLKSADKRDGWKKEFFSYMYSVDDKNVYVANSYIMWIIPKNQFYLDIEKVFINQMPLESTFISKMIKEVEYEAKLTGDMKVLSTGEKVMLFDCNEKKISVDEKLLKMFDLKNSHFKGVNEKSPIQIYEDDVLVGIVMPMRGVI